MRVYVCAKLKPNDFIELFYIESESPRQGSDVMAPVELKEILIVRCTNNVFFFMDSEKVFSLL